MTQSPNTNTGFAGTARRRISTETKASYKTSELPIYLLVLVGILIASAVADEESDFGTQEAWLYITLLTIGYLLSRGLAKSGSRDFYDDEVGHNTRGHDHNRANA